MYNTAGHRNTQQHRVYREAYCNAQVCRIIIQKIRVRRYTGNSDSSKIHTFLKRASSLKYRVIIISTNHMTSINVRHSHVYLGPSAICSTRTSNGMFLSNIGKEVRVRGESWVKADEDDNTLLTVGHRKGSATVRVHLLRATSCS